MTSVAFGERADWEAILRARLDKDRYDCAFVDFQACDLTPFDLLVPLSLRDYVRLASLSDAVRARALVPPSTVVSLCHDKLRFNRFLLATPHAWTIPRLFEEAPPEAPFVIKRREDEFGVHTHLVRTDEDRAQLRHLMGEQAFFMQRYIPGDREFATHILVSRGAPVFHLNVTYEMGDDFYVKSGAFRQKWMTVNRDEGELSLFSSILSDIGYENGTCCFNYKYYDGKVQVFELNPRFGGSLNRGINEYLHAYEAALSHTASA